MRTTCFDLEMFKVYKKDSTLERTKEFNAPIHVLDIRNDIKLDYSPIGFVRSGCTACRNSAFPWKMGKGNWRY